MSALFSNAERSSKITTKLFYISKRIDLFFRNLSTKRTNYKFIANEFYCWMLLARCRPYFTVIIQSEIEVRSFLGAGLYLYLGTGEIEVRSFLGAGIYLYLGTGEIEVRSFLTKLILCIPNNGWKKHTYHLSNVMRTILYSISSITLQWWYLQIPSF